MTTILRIGVPLLSFFLLTLVGMSVTREALAGALRDRRALPAGLLLPWIAAPLLATSVAAALPLSAEFKLGFLLLAACPTGGLANFFVLLARGRTALSLPLTVLSSLLACGATPALIWAFSSAGLGFEAASIPGGAAFLQLAPMLLLPGLLGMGLRRRFGDGVARAEPWLRAAGLIGLAALLVCGVASAPRAFASGVRESLAPVALFTAGAWAAGELAGRALGMAREDRFALFLLVAARNLAVATMIAMNFLGRADAAAFAGSFFCVQAPLLLAASLLRGRRARAERAPGQ